MGSKAPGVCVKTTWEGLGVIKVLFRHSIVYEKQVYLMRKFHHKRFGKRLKIEKITEPL